MSLYDIAKYFLFKMDAEQAHHLTISLLKNDLIAAVNKSIYDKNNVLPTELFGLKFKNPVGLAAGLDKNAEAIDAFAGLGFGFIEIGTITPKPQEGNPKPRLFRLPKDEALINRMGFNNVGAEQAKRNLEKRKSNVIVGGNIGKNKVTENKDAVKDYESCFNTLFDAVDYFVVNVSSPNTPGLRALQDKDSLNEILSTLQHHNHGKKTQKPILLKIAPDLEHEQLDEIIEIVTATKIQGIIATNTTISRNDLTHYQPTEVEAIGAGGLSGKPVTEKSTKVISYISKQSGNTIPIIGVGGIMNAQDAKDKIDAGAKMIQLYTGFIYKGPQLIQEICGEIR